MSADPVALARDLVRCPSVTPTEGGALAYLDKVVSGAGFTVDRIISSELGATDVEAAYWFVSARHWFTGPKVQGSEAELAAIERDLESI